VSEAGWQSEGHDTAQAEGGRPANRDERSAIFGRRWLGGLAQLKAPASQAIERAHDVRTHTSTPPGFKENIRCAT